jgi:serine/threonine protein phosphatase PrpC
MADFVEEAVGGEGCREEVSSEKEENTAQHIAHSSKNFRLAVAHEEMNSRRRNTMEDVHRVLPVLHDQLSDYSYLAVYDGHGGRQIVDYLEHGLESMVIEEFLFEDDASHLERITRAFLRTDMNTKVLDITTSGATAVVTLLSRDSAGNRRIISANVGDSRAVLAFRPKSTESKSPNIHSLPTSDNNNANVNIEDNDEDKKSLSAELGYTVSRLTYDHRAEDKEEQKRITEAGGFIVRNRVLGILAVSRSFGDHGMKDFVTAEPYVTIVDLDKEMEYPFLILACDGVWDVFSDQAAVDLILERYLVEGPFEGAAQLLVEHAIDRGSSDNITAIVAFL